MRLFVNQIGGEFMWNSRRVSLAAGPYWKPWLIQMPEGENESVPQKSLVVCTWLQVTSNLDCLKDWKFGSKMVFQNDPKHKTWALLLAFRIVNSSSDYISPRLYLNFDQNKLAKLSLNKFSQDWLSFAIQSQLMFRIERCWYIYINKE